MIYNHYATVIQKNWKRFRSKKKYNLFKRLPEDILKIITSYITEDSHIRIKQKNILVDMYLLKNKKIQEEKYQISRDYTTYFSILFSAQLADEQIYNSFRIKQIKSMYKKYNITLY